MSHGENDWYCKHCSDYWGGHFVNRGHRKSCFKCGVAKVSVFHGKPVDIGPPSRRVVTPNVNIDFKKENAKLRAEVARLKASSEKGKGKGASAPVPRDGELEKLLAEAKAVRALAKTVPGLDEVLAGKEATIDEMRASRLSVKPPSERMRQLEAETKRKQKDLETVQSKRTAATERIAKEQAAIAKLDADALVLAAAVAKLEEDVAKLAAELQSKTTHDVSGPEAAADTTKADAMEVGSEAAATVAEELGVEGGAKRVMEILAAATAASKKAKTGL